MNVHVHSKIFKKKKTERIYISNDSFAMVGRWRFHLDVVTSEILLSVVVKATCATHPCCP